MKTHEHTGRSQTSQRVARGSLRRMVGRLIQWWRSRKMDRAIRESSRRMNNLTEQERRELGHMARKIAYPNGYWKCRNHGDVIAFIVPAGEVCPICKSANADISRPAPK